MEEAKTLALLLVAAIVVSLGGTIVSLNKLGEFQLVSITGKQTSDPDTGYITLNITSETNIAVTKDIDFGNGYVNATCNNCTMWSNSTSSGTAFADQTCCIGAWKSIGGDTTGADTGMWVENLGNTNLTLRLNFSAAADTFIGGAAPNPQAQFMILDDNSARNCLPAGPCTSVNSNDNLTSCKTTIHFTGVWNNFHTNNSQICENYGFVFGQNEDEIVLDARVLVPGSATSDAKSVTLTWTGTSQ